MICAESLSYLSAAAAWGQSHPHSSAKQQTTWALLSHSSVKSAEWLQAAAAAAQIRWADFCGSVDEEHSSDQFPQLNCRGEFWQSSNKQLWTDVSKAATTFPAMIVRTQP